MENERLGVLSFLPVFQVFVVQVSGNELERVLLEVWDIHPVLLAAHLLPLNQHL